jgi:HlyD family secretion protein
MFQGTNRRATLATVLCFASMASAPGQDSGSPAPSKDVICEVDGPVTILKLAPGGSVVRKGDVVCELDSSVLRDRAITQRIMMERAKADWVGAVKTREIAEISIVEYKDGIAPALIQKIEGEIRVAEGDLTVAEAKKAELKNGPQSELKKVEAEIERARIAAREAKARLVALRNFTIPRELKRFEAELETARADESAKKQAHQLETNRLEIIERQLSKCQIVAPMDGTVEIGPARPPQPGAPIERLEEGAIVRERQLILRVVARGK